MPVLVPACTRPIARDGPSQPAITRVQIRGDTDRQIWRSLFGVCGHPTRSSPRTLLGRWGTVRKSLWLVAAVLVAACVALSDWRSGAVMPKVSELPYARTYPIGEKRQDTIAIENRGWVAVTVKG